MLQKSEFQNENDDQDFLLVEHEISQSLNNLNEIQLSQKTHTIIKSESHGRLKDHNINLWNNDDRNEFYNKYRILNSKTRFDANLTNHFHKKKLNKSQNNSDNNSSQNLEINGVQLTEKDQQQQNQNQQFIFCNNEENNQQQTQNAQEETQQYKNKYQNNHINNSKLVLQEYFKTQGDFQQQLIEKEIQLNNHNQIRSEKTLFQPQQQQNQSQKIYTLPPRPKNSKLSLESIKLQFQEKHKIQQRQPSNRYSFHSNNNKNEIQNQNKNDQQENLNINTFNINNELILPPINHKFRSNSTNSSYFVNNEANQQQEEQEKYQQQNSNQEVIKNNTLLKIKEIKFQKNQKLIDLRSVSLEVKNNTNINNNNYEKENKDKLLSLNKKNTDFPPTVTAKSWAIFDALLGKLIDGKFQNSQKEIASLTKIMTFYTSIQIIEKFDLDIKKVIFSVSKNATTVIGTTARLSKGTWISAKDLFYALMLPSGNDAAIVLSENFSAFLKLAQLFNEKNQLVQILYDRKKFKEHLKKFKHSNLLFISEMNKNARALEMTQTHFSNPHGLQDKSCKSSSYDIGILCCSSLKKLLFLEVIKTKNYECCLEALDRSFLNYEWENTNKMLNKEGWYGIKTGITDSAGPCLASCVKYFDNKKHVYKHIIIIILNSQSMDIRWEETEQLYFWVQKNL